MMSSWGRAIRRVVCCGSGADAPETSTDEPVYQSVEQLHQDHGTASTLRIVVESVDEIRRLVGPIADVQERMRRLELHLHPLLVYRPEDGEGQYMDMLNGLRPAPAACPEPPARSVWLLWLQERADYGEPWDDDEDTNPSSWVPSPTEALPPADSGLGGSGMSMSGLLRAAQCTSLFVDDRPAKRQCMESPQTNSAAQYPTPKGKGVGKKSKPKS